MVSVSRGISAGVSEVSLLLASRDVVVGLLHITVMGFVFMLHRGTGRLSTLLIDSCACFGDPLS